jgi:hypothetical protein
VAVGGDVIHRDDEEAREAIEALTAAAQALATTLNRIVDLIEEELYDPED